MRILLALLLATAMPLFAGCHCAKTIEPIEPSEMCITRDIASEVGLSYRGCIGNPAVFVAENAIWLPYKIITGPISGAAQGVIGSYAAAGEPITGTLLAPLGLAMGATIGTVNGFGQQPDVLEANDSLSDALAYPWITDHEVWKTSTPPSGTYFGR